jgi:hypothetical protein
VCGVKLHTVAGGFALLKMYFESTYSGYFVTVSVFRLYSIDDDTVNGYRAIGGMGIFREYATAWRNLLQCHYAITNHK